MGACFSFWDGLVLRARVSSFTYFEVCAQHNSSESTRRKDEATDAPKLRQYLNGKAAYVENVWNVLNWQTAEERFVGGRTDAFKALKASM